MLVTALTLAAVFVLLAIVLNAVIYTENLATRESAGLDTIDAARYEHEATRTVGAALATENAHGNASYQTMHHNVSRHTALWSDLTARHRAIDTRAVSTTLRSTTNGTRIVQDTGRSMTNSSGARHWTLVDDTTAVGYFTMTLDRASLVSPTNTSTASDLETAGVYHIVSDNGSDTRKVFVYASGANNVTVRVGNSSGVLTPGCEAPATGGTTTIELVDGTIDGAPCPGLAVLHPLETPSDVSFRDGANATGTYELVVNRPAIDADLGDPDSGTAPYGERILYDATVEVRYVSPVLVYENTTRVPGGEWE